MDTEIRRAIVAILGRETDHLKARPLLDMLKKLSPNTADLATWQSWAKEPDAELLAAVRQNSPLAAWMSALPSL